MVGDGVRDDTHAEVGVTPRLVRDHQQVWRDRAERSEQAVDKAASVDDSTHSPLSSVATLELTLSENE